LFRVPKKVANDIIRLQRKFLWCGGKEGRFMPLVKWKLVVKHKSTGGLGVGDIASKNAALLFKWWWRFVSEEGSLWKKVVQAIHNEKNGILPSTSMTKVQGPWQTIRKLINDQVPISMEFLQQMKVEVGNGERTKFWEDPWMQAGIIKSLFPKLYSISSQQNTIIARMGWFEGQVWRWILAWNRELSHDKLKEVDELHRLSVQYQIVQNKEDELLWGTEKCYTVKALQQLMDRGDSCDNLVCKAWMNLAPPKVDFFMWLALLGKLNTKEILWRKGLLQEDQIGCSFCSAQVENLDHILMACPVSWKVWSTIARDLSQRIAVSVTFRQHYEEWLARQWRSTTMKKFWCSTFFAIAWSLWLMRNKVIFQQKVMDVGPCAA